MHSFVRAGLLAATALVSSASSSIAHAEATAAPTQAGAGGGAEQPTSVGTGANDSSEILVTARRRVETAQQVPLAIAVIGGEHIDSTGSFNVGRLQQLTPALQFYSSNPRNTSLSIRGIGVPFGLTNDGFEQGVGIYIDDVYNSRVASATLDFLDVAQVEVLRGPQGTLYGKNTTAGAINISTRQPTFEFEGRAEVSVGNFGYKQAKVAISGPLSETVAARLALSSTSRRGTIYSTVFDRDVNAQDNLGLRGQILFQPNSDLDITLSGDFSRQNPSCCATVYVREAPTQRPLYRQYAALSEALGYEVASRNPFDRITDNDAALSAGNELGGAALRIKWDLGEGTLTAVSAWRYWDWKPANDRDYTGLAITTLSQNPSQQNQYTQELRYNYSAPRFDLVVGVFGFHQTVRTQGTEQLGPDASRWLLDPGVDNIDCLTNPAALACVPATLNGLTALNDIRLDNTSAALFGQLSWKVTDALTIQPGVRLNYDKKKGLYERRVYTEFGNGSEVTFVTPGAVATQQRAQLTPQRFEPRFSAWNFSYDLNISYKVLPDVLVYGTYAKSFKSGGINLNGVPNNADGTPREDVGTIKPESVNHYEVGIKSQFFDRRATLNIAAFRTDIRDFQALVNSGAVTTTRGYLANAEKVRTQGVEADFSLRPSERFNAYFNGAYTDAKYVRFAGAPCPPETSGGSTSPVSCDISGTVLPGVSKWSLSYGAEYNVPANLLGQEGQAYVGFDGNYRSRFSSNPSPSEYTWVEGYALSNFRLGFRTDRGLDIYGWVRNAFDVKYFELLGVAGGSTGLIYGQPADPRTWGATIKAEF
ncbi:MAG: TonB-dependent receptor [Pseudomonadota bacterium]